MDKKEFWMRCVIARGADTSLPMHEVIAWADDALKLCKFRENAYAFNDSVFNDHGDIVPNDAPFDGCEI